MNILKAALLGRSLQHSISPEVHKRLFEILNSKCSSEFDIIEYSNIELANENDMISFVRSGKQNGYRGMNVTFPYKFVLANLGAEVSPEVTKTRSANTILCEEPLQIISTDGLGFRFAVEKAVPTLVPSDYAMIVLGAGGAARAVLDAMDKNDWESITVVARSLKEAQRTCSQYKKSCPITLDEMSDEENQRRERKRFIVQATPVGQRTRESLLHHFKWSENDIAVDLVYNPLRTRFLEHASQYGATVIDGFGMLMEQAALSQYFWMTGKESFRTLLTNSEAKELHYALARFVTPRWDDFDT